MMSGRRAKALRRQVYGDYSPRFRHYATDGRGRMRIPRQADARRRAYQAAKRCWVGAPHQGADAWHT